jgi:hypothetical protein
MPLWLTCIKDGSSKVMRQPLECTANTVKRKKEKLLTAKDVTEFPLIAMKIFCHQLLAWRLLGEILHSIWQIRSICGGNINNELET